MRKATVEVLESKSGAIAIEYKGKPLRAVPYHQMHARAEEVSAKELSERLGKPRYIASPGKHHPWKVRRRGFSRKTLGLAAL